MSPKAQCLAHCYLAAILMMWHQALPPNSDINMLASFPGHVEAINMFADDIALCRIIKSRADYLLLQDDINLISSCIEQVQAVVHYEEESQPHTSSTTNFKWNRLVINI